jgi:hypothetical protein
MSCVVTFTLQVKLQRSGNDFASRLDAILSALREDDTPQSLVAKVTIVREGDHGLESRFFWHLIEDSASFSGGTFSYEDFVQFVNSGGGQGGPPGVSARVSSQRTYELRPRDCSRGNFVAIFSYFDLRDHLVHQICHIKAVHLECHPLLDKIKALHAK